MFSRVKQRNGIITFLMCRSNWTETRISNMEHDFKRGTARMLALSTSSRAPRHSSSVTVTFPAAFDFPALLLYVTERQLGGGRRKPANQHIRHVVNGAGRSLLSTSISLEIRVFPFAPVVLSLAGTQLSAGIRILFLK